MRVALSLVAYAALLNVVAVVWLRRTRWVERAPRIGVLAWQAISVGAAGSVVLAGFALAIPADAVSGGLADLLHACAMALRAQYATPGGATVAVAGPLAAFGVLARRVLPGYHVAYRSEEPSQATGSTRAHPTHPRRRRGCGRPRRGECLLPARTPGPHRAHLGSTPPIGSRRARCRPRARASTPASTAWSRGCRGHSLARAFPWFPLLTVAHHEIARLAELAADDAACRAI